MTPSVVSRNDYVVARGAGGALRGRVDSREIEINTLSLSDIIYTRTRARVLARSLPPLRLLSLSLYTLSHRGGGGALSTLAATSIWWVGTNAHERHGARVEEPRRRVRLEVDAALEIPQRDRAVARRGEEAPVVAEAHRARFARVGQRQRVDRLACRGSTRGPGASSLTDAAVLLFIEMPEATTGGCVPQKSREQRRRDVLLQRAVL